MKREEAQIGDVVISKVNLVKSRYKIINLKKTVCWVEWLCWPDGSTDDGPAGKIYKNTPYHILEKVCDREAIHGSPQARADPITRHKDLRRISQD